MSMIWHNGRFKNDEPVFMSHDRLRLGHGVFDTMLAVDGVCAHGLLHMQRLLRHAEAFQMQPNYAPEALLDAAQNLLRENAATSGGFVVNTLVTAGPGSQALAPVTPLTIQIVMRLRPLPEFPKEPLNAIIAKTVRRNEGSPLSQIKSCNYGDSVLAATEAASVSAHDAIMLNNRGHVACAASGNIFIKRGENLLTPPLSDGCIDGIVRSLMIQRLGAKEESITADDLMNCDGAFITSSLRGVAIIAAIDGKNLSAPSLKIDKDFHVR
jgi:branched-chain amino acid aminotransferase